ncbi:hypothetical protein CYMTET_26427 [Cymbomonas tetramitiformis]|uniref:Nucleotide-diphospho-sugar transferase domain-containing protein n=1 Tax=Cymbomonas tetramitiformis TaxID=36881 RepID=A0AAE0KY69_9CHLO|nr:hypothetical protein CYMTET_26427 [Cymbomonas tetramitiformis]
MTRPWSVFTSCALYGGAWWLLLLLLFSTAAVTAGGFETSSTPLGYHVIQGRGTNRLIPRHHRHMPYLPSAPRSVRRSDSSMLPLETRETALAPDAEVPPLASRILGNDTTLVQKLETPGALELAVEHLGSDGQVVLLAVGGSMPSARKHAVNALGLVQQLRSYGVPGTLLLAADESVCRFIAEQRVTALRSCLWTTFLSDRNDWWVGADNSENLQLRAMFARLMLFDRLLHLQRHVHVVFADNDVCFKQNPFPVLDGVGKALLFSGGITNFNLGVIYGRNDLPGTEEDLGLTTAVMERLKYLRQLGQNDTRFTGRFMKAMSYRVPCSTVLHPNILTDAIKPTGA